jgi:hypothetical protein
LYVGSSVLADCLRLNGLGQNLKNLKIYMCRLFHRNPM